MNLPVSATPSVGMAVSPADAMAAEDLRALAWLHDTERTPSVLRDLYRSGFPETLTLLEADHPAVKQLCATLAILSDTPSETESECSNDLAADYAGIYLTHAMRASPYESVWRDEDQLMMQAPTFAVREFYARHGVVIENWRHQPDDHVSHQLRFMALLLERGERREASRFARTHLMVWLPLFAEKVGQRAHTRFYADLAAVTLASVASCLQRLPTVAVIPPVFAANSPSGESGCGAS